MPLVYQWCQIVCVHNFLGNERHWKSHVLVSFHWCAKIKTLILAHMNFAFGGQNGAVDDRFCHCSVCCWRADIPWVVYEIAAYCELRSIGLFFLWSIIHTDLSVGYIFSTIFWNLIVSDVVGSVGAFLPATYPLHQWSKFIRKGCRPCFTMFGTF
jgi:hypothetical protein